MRVRQKECCWCEKHVSQQPYLMASERNVLSRLLVSSDGRYMKTPHHARQRDGELWSAMLLCYKAKAS